MLVNHHRPCVYGCGTLINNHPGWGRGRMQLYHGQFCEVLTPEIREAFALREAQIAADFSVGKP